MILADTTCAGQLNVPDMFTRMMLSLVATGALLNRQTEGEQHDGDQRERALRDGGSRLVRR